jgi:hypothetical protein
LALKLSVTVAAPMPVPVSVTCAVVVVAVVGVYVKMIVQLPPTGTTIGAAGVPPVQVPVMAENVPLAVPVTLITGAAVRLRGPLAVAAAVDALVTVIVLGPFAVVLAVPTAQPPVPVALLQTAGVGAEKANTAPVTVKGKVAAVPVGVVRAGPLTDVVSPIL